MSSGHLRGRIESLVSRGANDASWERCQWVREKRFNQARADPKVVTGASLALSMALLHSSVKPLRLESNITKVGKSLGPPTAESPGRSP